MTNQIQKYRKTRNACCFAYLSTSPVFILPPLLFVTFREMYGISYTALGSLVLINFCTQLAIDLVFTFFTKYFNLHKTLKTMPLLVSAGLLIYALVPNFLPQYAYLGLVTGTIIFSVAAGLAEVLLSPTVAALPSDDPQRDMAVLHSLYGYGALASILLSTLFFLLFGTENWMYLAIFFAIFPVICSIMFSMAPLPDFNLSQSKGDRSTKNRKTILALCLACIFLGSAAENTITNWISGYMENALHLPKTAGDLLGMAVFAILLAATRTVYSKYGKNIYKMLLVSMAISVVCYAFAGIAMNPVISLVFCVILGISTSMLWPGTLIYMEEKLPNPGVTAYALMAAGGDFGASVAPQAMGIVVDEVAASNWATKLADTLSLNTEQVGMKVGMLTAAIYPALGIVLLLCMGRYFQKQKKDAVN